MLLILSVWLDWLKQRHIWFNPELLRIISIWSVACSYCQYGFPPGSSISSYFFLGCNRLTLGMNVCVNVSLYIQWNLGTQNVHQWKAKQSQVKRVYNFFFFFQSAKVSKELMIHDTNIASGMHSKARWFFVFAVFLLTD